MLNITFKNLWSRKLRLVTTGLAIFIGVAFMAGTMVLTDTVTATFNDLFAGVNDGIDVEVRAKAAVEADGIEVRGLVDESVLRTVKEVDGVAAATGVVQGFTQITGSDGEPLGDPGRGAPTFGMSWTADSDLNPFHVVEGRAPAANDEVVIDRGSAIEGKLEVGDALHVDAARPVPPLKLVGLVAFGNADSPAGASVVGYTSEAAQMYVGVPGSYDAIVVRAEHGVTQDALRARVASVVPGGLEVLTGTEVTKQDQSQVGDMLSFFSTFMLTFALIALFVGSFIIYNTFSILVAQRMREVALLRAVGASRRQVLGAVVIESVLVGAIASGLGVIAGVGVAGLLKALLAAVGFDIPAGGIVLTTGTVITSFVTGLVVTMAAAVVPARRASKVAPVTAISGSAAETPDHLGRRVIAGALVTAVGAALGFYGLFVTTGNEAMFVGLGGLALFIGTGVLGPIVARPVAAALGAPLPSARGVAGTLARENAMRNPRRTSATAAALMIGVALVGFITIFATSAKAHVDDVIGEQFVGDFVVQSKSFGFGGLEPTVAQRISALPEIGAASGVRFAPAKIGDRGVAAAAIDPEAFAEIVDIDVTNGALDQLSVDGFAVTEGVATDNGWKIGDVVPAAFAATGETQLTLRAIYREQELVPDHLISTAAHDANFNERFDREIYVKKAEGVSTSRATAAISGALIGQDNADLVDRQGYIDAQTSEIDQMLGLIYVLLALAVVIAVLGIANTLALSIHERTRELGLLRAVGMTRAQLRSSVRWESVIISLFGAVVGLGLGIAFGWAMVLAVADEGLEALVIPVGQLAFIGALAALCGVLAALRPARRAAKLDVLAAIAAT